MISKLINKLGRRRLGPLLLAALLLAVNLGEPKLLLSEASYRYVFVFDITESMNVVDSGLGQAQSRLSAAKQAVLEALEALSRSCTHKAGLALFTANRTLLLFEPVTVCRHLREFQNVIATIDTRLAWSAASEVAKALYSGLVTLRELPEPGRIVFLTDGHEAPPINFNLRPPFNKGKPGEVSGLIVGVGGSTPMPIPKLNEKGEIDGFWTAEEVQQVDTASLGRAGSGSGGRREALSGIDSSSLEQRIASGTEHLSTLREDYLQQLAAETRLSYYRLTRPADLSGRLLNGEFAEYQRRNSDARHLLGALALVLLVVAFLPARWRLFVR